MHPYILKVTKDKKREKEIKNKTFEILVKHRYLIESHPRRANGSESLQTSFAVGPHYDEALKDFYEAQREASISYEPLDVESDTSNNFESSLQFEKINVKNLKKAFAEHFTPILHYEHFKMYDSIKSEEFEESLKIGKNLLKKFLHATYNSYYGVNYAITSADINRFIKSISNVEDFPLSYEQLTDFLTNCENISFEIEGVEKRSKETFDMYSKILNGFKRYIKRDTGAI